MTDSNPVGWFASWLFGEFTTFGDLVSDVLVLATLPTRHEVKGSTPTTYNIMCALLWVGTIIDYIHKIALLVGILGGLLIVVTSGPATMKSGGGREVLRSTCAQLWVSSR